MALCLAPSSFECDCGHKSHFFENTVGEMKAASLRRRKPMELWDSEPEDHGIVFELGEPTAVICPKLGKLQITGWA